MMPAPCRPCVMVTTLVGASLWISACGAGSPGRESFPSRGVLPPTYPGGAIRTEYSGTRPIDDRTMTPADWLGQARWWENFESGSASWSLRILAGQGSWRVERFGACGAALVVRLSAGGEAVAEMPLPGAVRSGSRYRAWLAGQGRASSTLSVESIQGSITLWSGSGTPGWQPFPLVSTAVPVPLAPARLIWRVQAEQSSGVALDDVAELQPAG